MSSNNENKIKIEKVTEVYYKNMKNEVAGANIVAALGGMIGGPIGNSYGSASVFGLLSYCKNLFDDEDRK